MATSPVEYRHEYVSGPVVVEWLPARVLVGVANRGATAGSVQALVWAWGERVLDSRDSEIGLVEAENAWAYDQELPPLPITDGNEKDNWFWVQVLTTSPDLVPTVTFKETPPSQVSRVAAFVAPGDFAVFTRHPTVVHPLPGPAEARVS